MPCNDVYGEIIYPYLQFRTEKDRLAFIEDLVLNGYTCQQIIKAVYAWVMSENAHSQIKKARVVRLVSDIEKNIFEGGRDDINLILFFDKLKLILTARE